jgi:hypothetical protein
MLCMYPPLRSCARVEFHVIVHIGKDPQRGGGAQARCVQEEERRYMPITSAISTTATPMPVSIAKRGTPPRSDGTNDVGKNLASTALRWESHRWIAAARGTASAAAPNDGSGVVTVSATDVDIDSASTLGLGFCAHDARYLARWSADRCAKTLAAKASGSPVS